MYHSRERQKESTEINASLYALKECVRARALAARGKRVQIPFRASNLTKVLMESLVRADAHLAVIATVSPIPTDTEHSVATLRTVCAIAGYGEDAVVEYKDEVKRDLPVREQRIHPSKWTPRFFRDWLGKVANGRFRHVAELIPRDTSGKQIMRWGQAQFSTICGGADIGNELRRLIRDEVAKCEELNALKRKDRQS